MQFFLFSVVRSHEWKIFNSVVCFIFCTIPRHSANWLKYFYLGGLHDTNMLCHRGSVVYIFGCVSAEPLFKMFSTKFVENFTAQGVEQQGYEMPGMRSKIRFYFFFLTYHCHFENRFVLFQSKLKDFWSGFSVFRREKFSAKNLQINSGALFVSRSCHCQAHLLASCIK